VSKHITSSALQRTSTSVFMLWMLQLALLTVCFCAVQCTVIGPVWVCGWVCYHDNSKLYASILSKLAL